MIIDELRVIGSPQTNVVMSAEVIRVSQRVLGRRPPEPRKEGLGQLVYPFDAELAAALVAYLRTPTRIVWDCFRSDAQRLEPLYDELMADLAADARPLCFDGEAISVEVRRVEAFAAGERQIVGTVKNALIDAAARRRIRLHVDPDRYDALWVARLDDAGQLVVSRDLGGRSLSQRGWRLEQGEAPLREHLAAVMAIEARYDPRKDLLVDPMCGAGTIAIEAALAARGAPVHGDGPALWPDTRPIIVAGDRDLDVVAAARDNARRAGVELIMHRGEFAAITRDKLLAWAADAGTVPPAGLVLCNPPWGERLDVADARLLYGALADWWRGLGDFRAGILCAHPEFEYAFGARWKMKKPMSASSNLRGYFYLYEPGG